MNVEVNIVLAETSVELVPRELWKHPAVVKNASKRGKKPGETLLDVSLHYSAMKSLPMREKRGRPDILHVTLLEALSSPLNLEGKLKIYVHTILNKLIHVDSKVRIPRDYRRFIGLIEQLLVEGRVPPSSHRPLLYVEEGDLASLLQEIEPETTILMWEKGEKVRLVDFFRKISGRKVAVIVGGFPHGDFSHETFKLADYKISIYPRPLETWCVVSRIISAFELLEGII